MLARWASRRASTRVSKFMQVGRVGVVTAVAAVALFTGHARGQLASGGFDEAFQPAFTTRDMVLFVDGLELDETQSIIVETLLTDYLTEFNAGVDNLRGALDNLRPELENAGNNPDKILTMVFGPVDEWVKQREVIGNRLIEDIKSQLDGRQMQLWPAIERRLNRERLLNKGRLSGESIDLVAVLKGMDIDPAVRSQIEPTVTEYEIALDDALRRRKDHKTATSTDMIRTRELQNHDKYLQMESKAIDFHIAVRAVNEQFTDRIAEQLPSELAKAFRDTVREQSYSRAFRPTPASRMLKAAMELQDLSPETLAAVQDVMQRHNEAVARITDELVALIREHEPQQLREKVENVVHQARGEAPVRSEDPVRDKLRDRDKVSQDYVTQLQAVLTAEQFAMLPGGVRTIDASQAGEDTKRMGSKEALEQKRRDRAEDSGRATNLGKGAGEDEDEDEGS